MTQTIHLPTRLIEAFDKDLGGGTPTAEQLARTTLALLTEVNWHGPGDCPECDGDHCTNPDDHAPYGHAMYVEAVQMLHAQAHNGPREPLDASRCTREPCVTLGGGLVPEHDARGLFAPGSRVPA